MDTSTKSPRVIQASPLQKDFVMSETIFYQGLDVIYRKYQGLDVIYRDSRSNEIRQISVKRDIRKRIEPRWRFEMFTPLIV